MSDSSEWSEDTAITAERLTDEARIDQGKNVLKGIEAQIQALLPEFESRMNAIKHYEKRFFVNKKKLRQMEERAWAIHNTQITPLINVMIDQANEIRKLQGRSGFAPQAGQQGRHLIYDRESGNLVSMYGPLTPLIETDMPASGLGGTLSSRRPALRQRRSAAARPRDARTGRFLKSSRGR